MAIFIGRHLPYFAIMALMVAAGVSSYSGLFKSVGRDALVFSANMGFTLENVEVRGANRTKSADIYKFLKKGQNVPIFALRLSDLKQEIEALPWIKTATLTRSLPSGLIVDVQEHTPFGLWQHDGQIDLINESGMPISVEDFSPFLALDLFVGNGADKQASRLVARLKKYPALYNQMKSAVRVGERRWDIIFDGGVRVKMPDDGFETEQSTGSGLSAALEKFASLNKEYQLLQRDITVVDLRISDKLIIRVNPDARGDINVDFRKT